MTDATQTATSSTATTHLGGDTTATTTSAATSTQTADASAGTTTPAATTTTTEAKPAPDAKPEGEKPAGEAKPAEKPAGAPEKYAEFTLPEGMKADTPVMGKFAEVAKKHGLSQEAAQELVNIGAEMQTGNAEALKASIEAQGETWGAEAKADKEFGGDKFDENLAVAKKALDQFATPELKTLLVQSKLGNHPEVIRLLFRAGKAIGEDGFVPGRTGAAGGSIAQRMYPNMNP